MSRPVPQLVRDWADARVGHAMNLRSADADSNHRSGGKVVDWKVDTAGMGVFFVIDFGPWRPDDQRYRETYRVLPRDLAEAVNAPRPITAARR